MQDIPPKICSHSAGQPSSPEMALTPFPLTLLWCQAPQFAARLVRKILERFSNEVMTYIAAQSDMQISSLPQICLRFSIPPADTTFRNDCVVRCTVTFLARARERAQGSAQSSLCSTDDPALAHKPLGLLQGMGMSLILLQLLTQADWGATAAGCAGGSLVTFKNSATCLN